MSSLEGSGPTSTPRSVTDVFLRPCDNTRPPRDSLFMRNSTASRVASVRQKDIPEVLRCIAEAKIISLSGSRGGSDEAETSKQEPEYMVMLFDVDALRASFASIQEAFPPHFKHCFAVKACPLGFVVDEALDAGIGIEAASLTELYLAFARGCPADMAVFDSPAKTNEELEMSLESGALVNANTLDELDRIAAILQKKEKGSEGSTTAPRVGVRLNPLVGAGNIAAFDVSVPSSKFGVPTTPENIRSVVEAFRRWPWLIALHAHVGSQGLSLERLAAGITTLCDIADIVDGELGKGRVALLDIGGGLPANYDSEDVTPSFAEYAAVLKRAAPSLFENTDRPVVTEFGRAVVLKSAMAVSAIEYIRDNMPAEHWCAERVASEGNDEGSEHRNTQSSPEEGYQTLVTHLGADLFMRTTYWPEKFSHRLSLYGRDGKPLSTPLIKTDVAGPLCFQGDYMGRGLQLPRATEEDLVVVHDTGANTLAIFSRHCSRPSPTVYGYARDDEGKVYLRIIRDRETIRDVARFWGVR